MKEYNGHRSWNAWNVSLWINNTEGLYRAAQEFKEKYGLIRGARFMLQYLGGRGEQTPDGGVYNLRAVTDAMRD